MLLLYWAEFQSSPLWGGALPETPLSGIVLELDAAAPAEEGESPRLASGFVGVENEGERVMRGILADDGEQRLRRYLLPKPWSGRACGAP